MGVAREGVAHHRHDTMEYQRVTLSAVMRQGLFPKQWKRNDPCPAGIGPPPSGPPCGRLLRRISGEVLWQEPAVDAAEMLRLADLEEDEEDTVA